MGSVRKLFFRGFFNTRCLGYVRFVFVCVVLVWLLLRRPSQCSFDVLRLITMAKGKAKAIAIKLLSTAGTGFFYVTAKNPRRVPHKLALRKVCKYRQSFSLFCPNIAN